MSQDLIQLASLIALVYLAIDARRTSNRAAARAEEVKATLENSTYRQEKKMDGIAKTGEAVHVLVNSKLGSVLRSLAIVLEDKANISGSTADRIAADVAKREADEHDAKQGIVDANDPNGKKWE